MKRSRVVDLTDDSTDVVVASWACAYCTFAHGDAEALFLACSACGQPRSKVAAAARDDDGSLALARTLHEQDSRDAEVRSVALARDLQLQASRGEGARSLVAVAKTSYHGAPTNSLGYPPVECAEKVGAVGIQNAKPRRKKGGPRQGLVRRRRRNR